MRVARPIVFWNSIQHGLSRCATSDASIRRRFTSLPIIDVSPLVDPAKSSESARVAKQLDDACTNVGFFYIKNHGVPEEVYSGVLREARRWFALPDKVKQQIALRPSAHYRGYQVLGANVTRFEGGYQRDWNEAIDLYREESADAVKAAGAPSSPIHGPNQWPSQVPQFDAALRRYIHDMTGLGAALMRGIAMALGLQPDYFDAPSVAGQETAYWCTRVIHYPPLAQGPEHGSSGEVVGEAAAAAQGAEVDRSVQLSCGEHTDYGLLTFVNQEAHMTALQVKNAAGQWISAAPMPGTFVCNIGDMLKVWTNGRYMPTPHRVLNTHNSSSRVSIPYFYEPAFEARVAPIPELCGTQGPKFPAVRYGSHLESKVLNNFEL